MQYEVDDYILEYIKDEGKYYISFKDSANRDCKIEINKEIFEIYRESKSAYIKIKNEKTRYLEQSELSENDIFNRSFNKKENVEDTVVRKILLDELKKAKEELTEVQMKRIELHIVNKVGITDLARMENVRRKQIDKSIELGLKKLKNFFNK